MSQSRYPNNQFRHGMKIIGLTVYRERIEGKVVNVLDNTLIVQKGIHLEVIRKKDIESVYE